MSGGATYHGLLVVVSVLIFFLLILIAGFGIPAWRRSLRADQAFISTSGEWQKSYRKNAGAVDAVITELESSPATYETFPHEVRDALYAAHEAAAAIEGKR